MSMGFMIAAASRRGNEDRRDNDMEMRRRDSRGRYMEGNDHSTYMTYDEPEMRRRRDSRGRYMEDEEGPRIAYEGNYSRNESAYRPWPEPHIPPYLDDPDMKDSPSRMRDKNIVNIRDYQDKRRIGFGENRMHHGEHKGGQKMEEGNSSWTPHHEKLTREKAEKWVRSMHGDDPKSRGEMWSYEDAKKLAEERGLPTEGQEMVDFYVVLNMVYTDYCKVAKEHGVDTEDYYADLAEAWLYDRDAKPPTEKLMAYHKYVIPHGEE